MSLVHYRYPLKERGLTTLTMPKGAMLQDVALLPHGLMLWALVDPTQPEVQRDIVSVYTGELYHGITQDTYVGITGYQDGSIVVHVHDLGESETPVPADALVFWYPEHGTGEPVRRIIINHEVVISPNGRVYLLGDDLTRQGEHRKFYHDKVTNWE